MRNAERRNTPACPPGGDGHWRAQCEETRMLGSAGGRWKRTQGVPRQRPTRLPRRIHLEPHLTDDELHKRYRRTADPVERSHWHFLWLMAGGMTATAPAAITGYSAYWIAPVARRYNPDAPAGVPTPRHAISIGRPALPRSHLPALKSPI